MKNLKTLMVATSLLFPTISCAGKPDDISVDRSDFSSKSAYIKAMHQMRKIELRRELGAADRVAAVELIRSGMREIGYEPAEEIELDFTSMEAYSKSILGKFLSGKAVVLLPHHRGVVQMVLPLKDLNSAIDNLAEALHGVGDSTFHEEEAEPTFAKLVSQDIMQRSIQEAIYLLSDLASLKGQLLERMEPIWQKQQAQYDKAPEVIGRPMPSIGMFRAEMIIPRQPLDGYRSAQREAIETIQFIPLDEIPSIRSENEVIRFFPRHQN